MKTCTWQEPDDYCMSLVEGRTEYCARHNRLIRKIAEDEKKAIQKHKTLIIKSKEKNSLPRKSVSKNPKDWKNTAVTSDGERLTEGIIRQRYATSRRSKYGDQKVRKCHGCGTDCTGNAHIIAKARCKQIGKTELIWDKGNYFPACSACNQAIENPNGKAWKSLMNIDYCLSFIKLHDPELFTKFELAAIDQSRKDVI